MVNIVLGRGGKAFRSLNVNVKRWTDLQAGDGEWLPRAELA